MMGMNSHRVFLDTFAARIGEVRTSRAFQPTGWEAAVDVANLFRLGMIRLGHISFWRLL
jgi:hypothetical protein